jgi:hypothetical protein
MNNVPTNALSLPTVTVYDAETNVEVDSGTAKSTNDVGQYYYQITPTSSSVDRPLRLQWDYQFDLDGDTISLSENSFASVVTPYATLPELIFELSIGAEPSDDNYIDPEQILFAERLARIKIDNYTSQTFGKRVGSQTVYGIGANSLFLREKMLDVTAIYEGTTLVYRSSPYYNSLSSYDLTVSDTGKIVIISDGDSIDYQYSKISDPFATTASRFANNKRYSVEGTIGWQYVPSDIRTAAILLVGDILTSDYEWRNKYLNQVNLSEVSFKINSAAFQGTGNATVDSILDAYTDVGIVLL